MKKDNRLLYFIQAIVLVLILPIFVISLNLKVQAGFEQNFVIADSIFDSQNTMSESDIQNFLNQFPNSCIKNYSAPYPINYFDYGNNVPASTVIRRAADLWGINPQIILVTLEKEESLVSGSAGCPDWRYNSAMGMGCPDGGSCPAPQYAGFSVQITKGSWQLKFSKERANGNVMWNSAESDQYLYYYGPFTQGYRKINVDAPSVYYDGYTTVDGQSVYLSSGATASLYSYTPHFSGNQNFAIIYERWFGSRDGETNTVNTTWNSETLEGNANSISTYDASVGLQPFSIIFNSRLYLFYYDYSTGNLRYAYDSPTGWVFDNIDGFNNDGGRINGDIGKTPTAIVYSDSLHVFYYDVTNGNLRHAWSNNGTSWQFETIDGTGGMSGQVDSNLGLNPTATILNSELQLFYYDVTNGNLRHAWTTGSGIVWHFENLDGDQGSIGRSNANLGEHPIVTTFNSELQLFYYDVTNGNLRHAWTNSVGWHFENLDGDQGSIGRSNANLGLYPAVTTFNSELQLFYYDVTNGNLRHAWTNSVGWHFENLDGDQGSILGRNYNTGITPALTSFNGTLYLFYYDQSNGDLRHAYSDNFGWHRANLDGEYWAVSQYYSNLGVDATVIPYNGTIQVYGYDYANNDLRHQWGTAP